MNDREKHSIYGLLFCQGCKNFSKILIQVFSGLWRCSLCSAKHFEVKP